MKTTHRTQPSFRRHRGTEIIMAGAVLLSASGAVTLAPQAADASPFRLSQLRPANSLQPALSLRPTLMARSAPLRAMFDAREELKAAYNKSLGQYNNLELDPALAGLDAALSGKEANDPATAPLRMLRAVIIFSNTGKADQTAAAFGEAVKADYNVALPTELRSPDLQKLLDKARKDSGLSAPAEAFQHTPPDLADVCGKDIVFTALASKVPDGGQLAFYWRPKAEGEFKTATMDTFGNLASVTLTASDHNDKPVEYFFYIFDASNAEQGNKGDQENPLTLDVACKKEEAPKEAPKVEEKPKSTMFRGYFALGIGTGLGLARGVADQSYRQYSPQTGFTYGPQEFACSVGRWYAGNTPLPSQAEFGAALAGLDPSQYAGYDATALTAAYDQDKCNEHHPVKTGMASAPLHLAPELGFRVKGSLVISIFGRLQLLTGSKVLRDDPSLNLAESYTQSVTSADPEGVRSKPGKFTGAAGIKIKYFLGQDHQKFRLFVGGMVGGGFARLRVPMGFANDKNGNSVPDDQEAAFDQDAMNPCLPVWPYGGGTCGNDQSIINAGTVAANADKTQRIDTVRIGGGFVGGLFGFNFQIVKNFALFGELGVSVWFPKTSSFLIDLTVGPAITF